jgi:hypothetical protein
MAELPAQAFPALAAPQHPHSLIAAAATCFFFLSAAN